MSYCVNCGVELATEQRKALENEICLQKRLAARECHAAVLEKRRVFEQLFAQSLGVDIDAAVSQKRARTTLKTLLGEAYSVAVALGGSHARAALKATVGASSDLYLR